MIEEDNWAVSLYFLSFHPPVHTCSKYIWPAADKNKLALLILKMQAISFCHAADKLLYSDP